jgi:hypothetical protein
MSYEVINSDSIQVSSEWVTATTFDGREVRFRPSSVECLEEGILEVGDSNPRTYIDLTSGKRFSINLHLTEVGNLLN